MCTCSRAQLCLRWVVVMDQVAIVLIATAAMAIVLTVLVTIVWRHW